MSVRCSFAVWKRYQLFIPACRKDCSTSNNEFLDSIVCTRPRPWEHHLSTKHRPSAILFLLVGEITVQRFSYIGLWALNAKLSLLVLWLSASWRCRVKNLEACWGLWCGHPSASRCHFSPTFEGERFRKNLSFTPFSDCLQLNIFQGEWLLSEKKITLQVSLAIVIVSNRDVYARYLVGWGTVTSPPPFI